MHAINPVPFRSRTEPFQPAHALAQKLNDKDFSCFNEAMDVLSQLGSCRNFPTKKEIRAKALESKVVSEQNHFDLAARLELMIPRYQRWAANAWRENNPDEAA